MSNSFKDKVYYHYSHAFQVWEIVFVPFISMDLFFVKDNNITKNIKRFDVRLKTNKIISMLK